MIVTINEFKALFNNTAKAKAKFTVHATMVDNNGNVDVETRKMTGAEIARRYCVPVSAFNKRDVENLTVVHKDDTKEIWAPKLGGWDRVV